MEYNYTFIKEKEFITASGTGDNPHDLTDITWTSSPGAEAVLKQMDGIKSVYTPTIGFVSIDNYKNDMYVQIAKFGSIYKNGWRFSDTNLPAIKPVSDVIKDETLAKSKTKKKVYVQGSGTRKSYWRMQEVGREEVDPKEINYLWDISLDKFQRLVSGDKQLLKERWIQEHKYKSYDTHPKLEYLRSLMSERIQHNTNPSLSYFDESIMDIGGISRHEQAVGMALSADEVVPLHVLKDYPELATLYEINISDSALVSTTPITKYTKLYEMPKDEYDRILDEVKVDCNTDPNHVTDKMLRQDYEEELADCKRSAKLRKKVFDKLPKHMRSGYTPDTMDEKLHKDMVWLAKNNNLEVPEETKAGYPTVFTDMPFAYKMTGNEECDAAANDILTEIRGKLGTDGDWYDHIKISHKIYDIIGATGESVPIMCGMGIETKEDEKVAEKAIGDMSEALIGHDLMDRIKAFKNPTGRARVMITHEDGIRSHQSNGVIHYGDYDKDTVAHEYGHAIEWMLPEIRDLSMAFLDTRTYSDPLVKLSDVVPYSSYRDDEETRPDNFMSPYIGKDYGRLSTEVLSMGMGYLTSSESMMDMYEQDPEFLGYIVAVLSGRAKGIKSEELSDLFRSESVEIDLSKLLNTTGLTRKKVLVRKPGQTPFWSTRWVQTGVSVKETVEAAGFELVAVEGEEPEIIDINALIKEAIAAGKAAFLNNEVNSPIASPGLAAIVRDGNHTVATLEQLSMAWRKGWAEQSLKAPAPDNFDTMPDVEPEPKQLTAEDVMQPAYEAGGEAFKRGLRVDRGRYDTKITEILESISHLSDEEKVKVMSKWIDGWSDAQKKAKIPEPEHVFAGESLADRIDKKSKMKVPGVGTVPAIAVKNIQMGDRLQFIEGVYRIKGVIVKGASSTIIFEETDDDGNNLKLKKQNRTFLGVERTQLKSGGYVSKPETGEPKVVPHWAREKTSKGIDTDKLVSTTSGFVPAKTVKEATDRLSQHFLKSEEDVVQFSSYRGKGVSLDGLKLTELNSIIHGMERTIGRYNIKLDHIGWNDKKQTAAALYTYLGDYRSILFQKTATKNIKARHKKTLENFDIAKERNIANQKRYLTYKEIRPGDHDRDRKKIEKLDTLKRWTVDTELDHILVGTVVHEGHHAIYYQKNLKDKWHDNIERLVGRELSSDIKCASVSEYGMTNMRELFAEVGVAVEFGVEIDPDVKQAYLDTMEGIK